MKLLLRSSLYLAVLTVAGFAVVTSTGYSTRPIGITVPAPLPCPDVFVK